MTTRSDGPHKSRSESALVQLRHMIMNGEFASGFHLQETPLASLLGVSRTPIREALNSLAKEGLLEPGPKRGYKVRTFTIEEIMEAYELRATLEGMACRLVAECGLSADESRVVRECLDLGDRLLQGGTLTEAELIPWREMNTLFHSSIVKASRNVLLGGLIAQCQSVPLASTRHVHWYRLDKNNYDLAYRAHVDHHEIMEAILGRQAGRAEARMREHIYFSQQALRKEFEQGNVGIDTRLVPQSRGIKPS